MGKVARAVIEVRTFDGGATELSRFTRTAMIDVLAMGKLSQQAGEALVRAALCQMAQDGIQVALLMRRSGHSARTLLTNGCIPMPADMYIVAGTFEKGPVASEVKHLQMPCR
jgi:hypothetical protein